jgi:hypothetical protein
VRAISPSIAIAGIRLNGAALLFSKNLGAGVPHFNLVYDQRRSLLQKELSSANNRFFSWLIER